MIQQSLFAALKHLIRDTFRQAWASGISWVLLVATGVCVLLCLSVSVSNDATLQGNEEPGFFLPPPPPRTVVPSVVLVLGSSNPLEAITLSGTSQRVWYALDANPTVARQEGIETIRGNMSLAFGAMSIPLARERRDAIHFLELVLAGGVAGTLGLLLALVWTAGFVPAFLEPGAAAVLLAKPVARWQLLLGKYLGVLTFLGLQVTLFVVLTWLALGVRTNVWDIAYWWSIPLVLLQFAIFYSFSVLVGVVTRSVAATVTSSVLFWLVAWAINYGAIMAQSLPQAQELPVSTRVLSRIAYWISPKPIDAGCILFNSLDAGQHFDKPTLFRLLESGDRFSPELAILSSILILTVLLGLAIHEFNVMDY